MHRNNPWDELYKDWPVRNNREVKALKLLAERKCEKVMEETGMNYKEYRSFYEWARQYEVDHLCVRASRKG